jgi:hypothetical protein
MSNEDLFVELRKLNRVDKLLAMQLLVLGLAAEESATLMPGTEYEVWSPFDAPDAVEALMKLRR